MKADILVGGQWGDEGKAKIIDFLSSEYDIICRYQGGSNAGHTVVYQNQKYIFHLLPSGLLNPNITAVLGHGMVIYLPQLINEINELERKGIEVLNRIKISDRAFLVTDYHLEMDRVKEKNDLKIGTTIRGIGPAYTDKYAREGIRVIDLFYPAELLKKITKSLEAKTCFMKHYYQHDYMAKAQEIVDKLLTDFNKIKSCVDNTAYYLNEASKAKKHILLEGAQGAGLDIDFGSYPYVTSSSPTSGGGATGSGIAVNNFEHIIGIFKTYITRVGEGAMPTMLSGDAEELLREKGGEFGATTGRSRGCGWFDGVQAKYSVMINGVSKLALTKLDVLAGLKTVKFCTHYTIPGKGTTDRFPSAIQDLSQATPVYKEFPGWEDGVYGVKCMKDLHPNALAFIRFFEEYLTTPVKFISTGPERESTIVV